MTSSFREMLVSSSSTKQSHVMNKFVANLPAPQGSIDIAIQIDRISEATFPDNRARNLWRSIQIQNQSQGHLSFANAHCSRNETNFGFGPHNTINTYDGNGGTCNIVKNGDDKNDKDKETDENQIHPVFGSGDGPDDKRNSAEIGPETGIENDVRLSGPFMKQTCALIRFLCRFNLIPCDWKEDTCQLVKRSNFYYNTWFVTVALASWLNFAFVLFRFVQEVFINWKKLQKNDVSVIIGLWGGLAFKTFVAVAIHNFQSQTNLYIAFTNQLMRLRLNPNRPEFRKDFAAAKTMGIIFSLRTLQLIWTGCAKATRPQFVYSLVPPNFRNFYTYSLYVVFQIYSSLNAWVLLYFASLSLSMIDTTTSLLKTNFPPSVSARSKLMMYKQLQILLVLYNNATRLGLVFLKIYTLSIGTTCAFGCIRFYDDLDFRIYLTLPLSLISLMAYAHQFYGKAGKIPAISRKAVYTMFSQRTETNRRVVAENRSCLFSCRRLMLAKIGRHVFPNIVRFVVVQTIRLMIVMSRRKDAKAR